MHHASRRQQMTRRQMLRTATALTGGAAASALLDPPWGVLGAWWGRGQTAQPDALAQRRAQMAAVPISIAKLTANLLMLSGPGGNVAVLSGPDGLIAVDTFVRPAWPALEKTLDGLGDSIKAAINTHWHFDHSDNNANFRRKGAVVIGHANTAKRLSERHEVFGLRIEPSPEAGRPTQTFTESYTLAANGESLELAHLTPAHTDTDIYVRFPKANVLHLGDTYFNGGYPFIDATTGGRMAGMIEAADRGLKLADRSTKIVPGHGPLADREALTRYRDMLVTVRDRVQKLKAAGRKVEEVVAEKPTKDLDASWGKDFLPPDMFVAIVYDTL